MLKDGQGKDVHRTDGGYFRITILRVSMRRSLCIHKTSSAGLKTARPGCIDNSSPVTAAGRGLTGRRKAAGVGLVVIFVNLWHLGHTVPDATEQALPFSWQRLDYLWWRTGFAPLGVYRVVAGKQTESIPVRIDPFSAAVAQGLGKNHG